MSLNQQRIPVIFAGTSFSANVNSFIVLPKPQKNFIFQMDISIYEKVKLHSTAAGLSFSAG